MAKPTIVKSSVQPVEQQQVKLPIVDNLSAPDIYADETIGCLLANNTLRITLASVKMDHTKTPNTNSVVVTGRLVLPVQAAQNLHKMLTAVLEKVKAAPVEQGTQEQTLQ